MSQIELEGESAAQGGRAGSLKPVIDIIPAAAYENPTWKGMAYFARDLAMYAGLVAALIFVSNPFIVAALEVVMALVTTALFVVAHDAAHGALFKSKRINGIVGRIAMLPSMHVFEGWVLGHNRVHHPYTVRQGYDFVWHPYTVEDYRALSWFGKLRHRFEWSWFGAGAYYFREVWLHKMIIGPFPGRWIKSIHRDRALVLGWAGGFAALLAFTSWAMGGSIVSILWMIARVEVIPFLAFCVMIGSVVHVHHVQPTIRWWKKAEWTKFRGQMEGTTILRVPKWLDFFFHWIMVHTPHHVDLRIPMYNLPMAAKAIEEHFPAVVHDAKLRFSDFRANTKTCKLYDFELGRWLPYSAARKLPAAS